MISGRRMRLIAGGDGVSKSYLEYYASELTLVTGKPLPLKEEAIKITDGPDHSEDHAPPSGKGKTASIYFNCMSVPS